MRKYRSDLDAVAYLVALPGKEEAIELIHDKAASPGDEIEDLGRVSEPLIAALALSPGEFVPIAGLSHVAQQQQQPQPDADKKA